MKKLTVLVENTKEIEKVDQQYIISKMIDIKNSLGFAIDIDFVTTNK